MSIDQIPLRNGSGRELPDLRELCGFDEQSITGTGTSEAIRLLDRLLVRESDPDIEPVTAPKMTTADRDRLMAAVYMRTYGTRVENSLQCENCNETFDIDFSLEDLIRHLDEKRDKDDIEEGPDGTFKLSGGERFRLPTGEDECAVRGMSPEQAEKVLVERCLIDGNAGRDHTSIQDIMNSLAPVIDVHMDAVCPECNYEQIIHFDIQHYLLTSLAQEKRQLAYEIHRLAVAYGWSLHEILGLPRSLRKAYVALVESERDVLGRRHA